MKNVKCIISKITLRDPHGKLNCVNPTQLKFDFKLQKPVKIQKQQKIEKCLGDKLNDYMINDTKIFKDLTDREKGRIMKVFGGTLKYNKDIINIAQELATDMQIKCANHFMSLTEIIAAETQGPSGVTSATKLSYTRGPGKIEFIERLLLDVNKASELAKTSELIFVDPYTSVYHFRKHYPRFATKFSKFSIESYRVFLPKLIFQDLNLIEICILNDGAVKKTYTSQQNFFGITIGAPRKQIISTMFVKENRWNEHFEKLHQKSPSKFCLFFPESLDN